MPNHPGIVGRNWDTGSRDIGISGLRDCGILEDLEICGIVTCGGLCVGMGGHVALQIPTQVADGDIDKIDVTSSFQ